MRDKQISIDPMQYPTNLDVLKEYLEAQNLDAKLREHKIYSSMRDVSPIMARIAGDRSTCCLVTERRNLRY